MDGVASLDESAFFEFLEQRGPAVVFVSAHPLHAFSEGIKLRLDELCAPVAVPFGSLELLSLVLARSPVLSVLQERLATLDTLSDRYGVLPGYYFFCDGQLLAYSSGLPTTADAGPIVQGAFVGALWYGLTGKANLLGYVVRWALGTAPSKRVAEGFVKALEEHRRKPRGAAPFERPASAEELTRAYTLLEIVPEATDTAVNEAWKRLRVKYHPDRAVGDPAEVARRTRLSCELNHARDVILQHRERGRRRRAA